jgi:hypothetical protein
MAAHKVMGVIAGLGLFIACATLKRAGKDEVQCLVPTAAMINACANYNPIVLCPAIAVWLQCLAQTDQQNSGAPIKVRMASDISPDGGVH